MVIIMLSDTLSDLDKLDYGKYSKYQLHDICHSACLNTILQRQIDLKQSQEDRDALGNPQ